LLKNQFYVEEQRANLFEMRTKIKLLTNNLQLFNTEGGVSLSSMLVDVNKFISMQYTNINEFTEISNSTVQF
jgi:hypothetical protein